MVFRILLYALVSYTLHEGLLAVCKANDIDAVGERVVSEAHTVNGVNLNDSVKAVGNHLTVTDFHVGSRRISLQVSDGAQRTGLNVSHLSSIVDTSR